MRNLNIPQLFRNMVGAIFASKADLLRGKRASNTITRTGHVGSKPNQSNAVARRRTHKRMTKRLQRVRRSRGRNQGTG